MYIGEVEGRGNEFIDLSFSFMDIYFFRAAHRLKDAAVFACRLALPQEKISSCLQSGMENGKQRSLQDRLKINHDIAAANQIQFSERRIGQHIMRGKNDHPPDLF